jgi:hypothetical protein
MARQPKPAEPTPKEIGTSKNSSKNGVTSTNDGSKDDVEQLSNRNNVFDGDEFDVNTRSAVDR